MDNDLRVKRAEAELSQQELANVVGVSRQTIYAIENSKYDPSLELAFKLARYFDCSIEDIFHPDI